MATNTVETRSSTKYKSAWRWRPFLIGESSVDGPEVSSMKAKWEKLLVFMAVVYVAILADAIRVWRGK